MDLLFLFYLMLPAYFANMAPVFFRGKFTWLAKPVDMGLVLRGHRLLGDNKTLRGFVFGILFGILISGLQYLGDSWITSPATQLGINWILLGTVLSVGALGGDALKSFFKRQAGIASGKSFVPFDQIDYSLGAVLLLWMIIPLTLIDAILIVVLSTVLHIIVNLIGYYLNIRKQPW